MYITVSRIYKHKRGVVTKYFLKKIYTYSFLKKRSVSWTKCIISKKLFYINELNISFKSYKFNVAYFMHIFVLALFKFYSWNGTMINTPPRICSNQSLVTNIGLAELFIKRSYLGIVVATKLQNSIFLKYMCWLHFFFVRFVEKTSAQKSIINLNFNFHTTTSKHLLKLQASWTSRLFVFKKLITHKLFVKESLLIFFYSLLNKNIFFLTQWIERMFTLTNFFKHKNIFRYVAFMIKSVFYPLFNELAVKGVHFFLKGKISVSGNARSRALIFKKGSFSSSNYTIKYAVKYGTISTYMGVLGYKMFIAY